MQELLEGDNLIRIHITRTATTLCGNLEVRNKNLARNCCVQHRPKITISGWARFDKSGQANKKPYSFSINHFRPISISFCLYI